MESDERLREFFRNLKRKIGDSSIGDSNRPSPADNGAKKRNVSDVNESSSSSSSCDEADETDEKDEKKNEENDKKNQSKLARREKTWKTLAMLSRLLTNWGEEE